MSREELQLIQKILPTLYKHFKRHPNSLLARVYGVYEVRMKNYDPVILLLMGNTLRFRKNEYIYKIYDLKGSRVARKVDTTDAKPTTTLKDVNFFSNSNWEQEVRLSKEVKSVINSQLQLDSKMLSELNIMDYSLLLGIERRAPNMPVTPSSSDTTQ
jgi:1-phosphatidylinositol-4-phosphate 5-kinase